MNAHRRGLALLAVLILVVVGALVAGGVLVAAAGARAETDAATRLTRSRLAATAGVRAAMAELNDQRDAILTGADPELTESWTLETTSTGRQIVVRLIPIEPDGPIATSEATRIDLGAAPASVLARWCDLTEAEAEALRAELDANPPAAPEDALARLRLGEGAPKPTVYLVEPDVIAGVSGDTIDRQGAARLRPGDTCETPVETAALNGLERSPNAAALARRLVDLDISPLDWGAAFDAISITDGGPRLGRVDLNRAAPAALALLPGLDDDLANQLVSTRERLDDQTRRSIAWPVTEGILDVDSFAEAVPWLTTTSWQWRVRIEAGTLPPADLSAYEGIGGISDEARLADALSTESLEFPIILEAVVDLSVSPPRLAYLAERTPHAPPHDDDPAEVEPAIIDAFAEEPEPFAPTTLDPILTNESQEPPAIDQAEPQGASPVARWRGVSPAASDR